MLNEWEQNIIKELVSKSDLQKHNVFERENEYIWNRILKEFNLTSKKNLSIEDLREEWTHIYETIGYAKIYPHGDVDVDSPAVPSPEGKPGNESVDASDRTEIGFSKEGKKISSKQYVQVHNPIKSSSNSSETAKLGRDVLISLVHTYFGNGTATLKGSGREKWKDICKAYNEIGKDVFENMNAVRLNSKWRNIVYRAKLMKEPHPLDKPKHIIDLNILKEKINQTKSSACTNSQKDEEIVQNKKVSQLLNSAIQRDSPANCMDRLKLSDVKREFGIETLDYTRTHTRQRLSRDILIYLVNKYDAYLPANSLREGNTVWKSVAREYNEIGKGLFSFKEANQLNGKWRNILYHARKFGYPHPLESQTAYQQTESDLKRRVEEYMTSPRIVESKAIQERNDYLKTLDVTIPIRKNAAKYSFIRNTEESKKVVRKNVHVDRMTMRGKAKIRRRRVLGTLEFEQERLKMLKENNKIEKDRLSVELQVAKVQLEREIIQLSICKNEAQMRGVLK